MTNFILTCCRWRKSRLNDEVLQQLKEVLAVYSYDYVIPDINDAVDVDDVSLAELIGKYQEAINYQLWFDVLHINM